MAVHTSVIKRHQQSLKRRARNIETKSKLRTLIKKTRQAIESKNAETASVQLREVNKALSKAVSKGVIKHNTGSLSAKGTDVAMEELVVAYERLEME